MATTRVWFEDPIEVDAAQAMVGTATDISVIWAGFEVVGSEAPPRPRPGVLGYATCGTLPITVSGR